MSTPFDPYYRWLGIPSEEQPPHHYRLLGVRPFESDPDVIDAVALRHIAYLQEIHDGPHVREAQQLLNELAAARRCLLDPKKKREYDETLRKQLDRRPPPAAAAPARPPRKAAPPLHASAAAPPEVGGRESEDASPGSQPTLESSLPVPDAPRGGIDVRADAMSRRNSPSERGRRTRPATAGARTTRQGWLLVAGSAAVALVGALLVAGWRGMGERESADETAARSERPEIAAVGESRRPSSVAGAEHARSTAAAKGEDSRSTSEKSMASTGDDPDSSGNRLSPPLPGPLGVAPPGGVSAHGLLLWLDASQLPPSDGPLDRWPDLGAQSLEVIQASPSERPQVAAAALGGRPLVRFSGNAWMELKGSADLLECGSRFTVIHVAAGGDGVLLSKGAIGGRGDAVVFAVGAVEGDAGQPENEAASIAAQGDDPRQFRVRSIVNDGERLAVYVNSTLCGEGDGAAFSVKNWCNGRLGVDYFAKEDREGARWWRGALAELLIYDRPLEDDVRRTIEEYLFDKWCSGGEPEAMPGEGDAEAQPVELSASPAPQSEPGPGDSALPQAGAVGSGQDSLPRDSGLSPSPLPAAEGPATEADSQPQPSETAASAGEGERQEGQTRDEGVEEQEMIPETLAPEGETAAGLAGEGQPGAAGAASGAPPDEEPAGVTLPLFVNLGGGPGKDAEGNEWVASREFDGKTFGHDGGENVTCGGIDSPVFASQRRKLTAFRAVVPNGTYAVQLLFYEEPGQRSLKRSFAVTIEGAPIPGQPFHAPGMGAPLIYPVRRVEVRDERLDVDFFPLPGSLTILNGIAIRRLR